MKLYKIPTREDYSDEFLLIRLLETRGRVAVAVVVVVSVVVVSDLYLPVIPSPAQLRYPERLRRRCPPVSFYVYPRPLLL